jgi:beta-lactamase regulating signal transducer with metallopeptidase domain
MTMALWLATYLLHSTVLCGTAVVFRRRLRRLESVEWVWRTAVFLPVLTATAVQFGGSALWTIDVGVGAGASAPLVPAAPANGIDVLSLLMAAWVTIAGALIARDWLSHRWFVRRLGTRHRADAVFVAALADVLRRSRVRRPIRLTYSAAASSPVTLGRSEICLSMRAMRDLGSAQLRALLAHEVAHIARADGWWFAAVACLESALFLQPLNRVARRELRHLAETACDDWAAREVGDRIAMAHCLVEVASWSRTARPVTVPGVAGTSNLADRVTRLLDAPRPPLRMPRLALTAAVVASALALPCLAPTAAVPAELATPSAEYEAGFEAGRRFAAGQPDARRQSALDRPQTRPPARSPWRAEYERQLQARTVKARP